MKKAIFHIKIIVIFVACFAFAILGAAKAEMYKMTKGRTPTYTNVPVKITPSTKVIEKGSKKGSTVPSSGSAGKKAERSTQSSRYDGNASTAESTGRQGSGQNTGQGVDGKSDEKEKAAAIRDYGPPR
jgi:hypothetical protein